MGSAKRSRPAELSARLMRLTSIRDWLHNCSVDPVPTCSTDWAVTDLAAIEVAQQPTSRLRLVSIEQDSLVAEAPAIRAPREARDALMAFLGRKDREHFAVLHLDTAHQLISTEIVSVGTLNAALVHPREVFKGAILANAASIICAHNHPSGRVTPSQEDRTILARLKSAAEILGITLLDFLIVSEDAYWSSSESDG